MSRKDYNLLVVEELLKGENHLRGLAKAIGTTQTTVARSIAMLAAANVLDYRPEGKNKVLFLKRTLEAKQHACIVEHRKLLRTVERYPALRRIIEAIRQLPRLPLVILFGSYAKGTANEGSDIDLYVETRDRKVKGAVEAIDTRLSVKIGRYDSRSLLIKEIEKHHVVIKGVDEYYEKSTVLA